MRAWLLLAAVLLVVACSTVYVVTGHDSKITTDRDITQDIGRKVGKDRDKDEDNKP